MAGERYLFGLAKRRYNLIAMANFHHVQARPGDAPAQVQRSESSDAHDRNIRRPNNPITVSVVTNYTSAANPRRPRNFSGGLGWCLALQLSVSRRHGRLSRHDEEAPLRLIIGAKEPSLKPDGSPVCGAGGRRQHPLIIAGRYVGHSRAALEPERQKAAAPVRARRQPRAEKQISPMRYRPGCQS